MKGLKPKNKGHTNFYECCDLTKKVYLVFIYTKVLSIRQVLTEDYLLFSGTIADREHRKWIEKAVPLQNNPYSKESLEKRLSRTSVDSGTSTLQSR